MSTEDDKWLHAMLQSAPAERTAACLDPDRLAAWSDGALDPRERADVELHVSTCGYCLAAVTALQRTAPATPEPHRGLDRARLFRWLVPLTAAATAVAIWVAVNDGQGPLDRLPRCISHDRTGAPTSAASARVAIESGAGHLLPGAKGRKPGDGTRVGARRFGSAARRSAAAPRDRHAGERRVCGPRRSCFSSRAACPRRASGSAAGSVADCGRAFGTARGNGPKSRVRRVALPEGSADGVCVAVSFNLTVGPVSALESDQGWYHSRTVDRWRSDMNLPNPRTPGVSPGPPAVVIASIRAVDERRAVATTSDRREFYTTDGGASWTLVQENESAPF